MLSCMLMHYAARTKKVDIFYEKQTQNQRKTTRKHSQRPDDLKGSKEKGFLTPKS